ncbi:MAG TPA: hypothetical protein VFL27_12935 [Candidatus Dormibacteraeota bacterium]|nr:hypothetical protein [Candidatus Dormibacteraeota bacterium]
MGHPTTRRGLSHEVRRAQPARALAGQKLATMAARFPDIGLTLSSIIQAVTLGVWASVVASQYSRLTLTQWLVAIAMFVFIVNVWHHILIEVLSYEYVPGFVDTLLFFGTGGIELFMVYTMSLNFVVWLAGMTISSGAPLVAVLIVRNKAIREGVNAEILAVTEPLLNWRLGYSGFAVIVSGICLFFAALDKLNYSDSGVRAAVSAVIAGAIIVLFAGYSLLLTLYWRSTVRALRTAAQ